MTRYIFAGIVIAILLQIDHDIRSFDNHMLSWRCNQTGLCRGYDEGMEP